MKHRRTLLAVALTALGTGACQEPETGAITALDTHTTHEVRGGDAEVNRWLAQLRQATVHMKEHDRIDAGPAGWPDPVLGCMELPGTGGMGYHFGDMSRMGDDVLDDLAPELLVYEPQKNGRLRLVAVEYLVPFAVVPYDPQDLSNRPFLHGVGFHPNEGLGVWVLHAWIWKNNPAGMFENWNPTVNCQYAWPED